MYSSFTEVLIEHPSPKKRQLFLMLRAPLLQQHGCRISLAKLIALYRYIVQFKTFLPQTAIKRLIVHLKVKSSQLKSEQDITQFFNFPEKSISLSSKLLLEQAIFQQFHQSRVFFGKRQAQKLPDLLVNGLEICLRFNADLMLLMEGDDCLSFSNEELAKMFMLQTEKIANFKELYLKNQERVISISSIATNDCILSLFAIKLKLKIIQRLEKGQSASEINIQKQLFEIAQFYLEKQAKMKKQQGKLKFSLAYFQVQNGTKRLKFSVWEELIYQLRYILNKGLNQHQLAEQLREISKKYFIRLDLIQKTFSQLASPKKSKLIQKKFYNHKQVVDLYECFKIRYPKIKLMAIAELIKKEMGINAIQYIRQYCQTDIQKVTSELQSFYFYITVQIIRQMINRGEQVLFVDHIQFFQRQFVYFDLLNEKNNLDYRWKVFGGNEEAICRLILGVSNKGIRFHSITHDHMSTITYLKEVLRCLVELDKGLPKAVVLYFFINATQRERVVISKIAAFLDEMGVRLFYLPKYVELPNISKRILTFIKHQALVKISEHVYQANFRQLLKRLIKKYLKMMMIGSTIKKLAALQFDANYAY